MAACDDKLPPKAAGVAEGPDIKDVIACVRGHGLDAPTAPDAFKRWLAERTRRTRAPLDAAMRDCKMALAPGPSEGPVKPGGCVNDVRPADGGAKPDAAKQGAARARHLSAAPAPARQRCSPGPRRSASGASSARTRASTSSLHSCVRIRR